MGRPGREVSLAGGKLDELHAVVGKLLEAREAGAAPQRDALPVHGGEEITAGRPLHVRLGPEVALVHLHGFVLLRVVPVDLGGVAETNGVLVAAALVEHVALGVLARDVGLGLGGLVRVGDRLVLGEVVEAGHLEDVRLVELVAIRLLARRRRLLRVAELDEGETLGAAVGVGGHVQAVLVDHADLAEDLLQDGGELLNLGAGNLGEVVHHDHATEAGVHLHLLHVDLLVIAAAIGGGNSRERVVSACSGREGIVARRARGGAGVARGERNWARDFRPRARRSWRRGGGTSRRAPGDAHVIAGGEIDVGDVNVVPLDVAILRGRGLGCDGQRRSRMRARRGGWVVGGTKPAISRVGF